MAVCCSYAVEKGVDLMNSRLGFGENPSISY